PKVVPEGVAAVGGIAAVRLADPWSGTFRPAGEADPLLEDPFLRAWGPLPDGANVAAALRWPVAEGFTARAALKRPRLTIRPALHLEVSPGRVDLRAEAGLATEGGPPRELTVGLP